MGESTTIGWTDHTFNPWHGCQNVSPGCDHCYAEAFSKRCGFQIWGKELPRRFFADKHWAEPRKWNDVAAKQCKRQRVFCGSMCDVMEDRPDLDDARDRLFDLIYETPNLDWLLLTKRPQNFRRFLPPAMIGNPLRNVCLMTTVESPEYLWRVDALVKVPAVTRAISYEPALTAVDFTEYCPIQQTTKIHQIIVGGESGPGARPFDVGWARSVVKQCRDAGVAPFVKQLGSFPIMAENAWREAAPVVPLLEATHASRTPAGFVPLALGDRKGENWDGWPSALHDLRVREFPHA